MAPMTVPSRPLHGTTHRAATGVALALLAAVAQAASPAPLRQVTVWLAGDSTIAAKRPSKRPETGWGEALDAHFRSNAVIVDNRAVNGRSTRTFLEEGRWQALLDGVRAGDVVMIQFGHNDASIDKPDRYTPLADYRANLVLFVGDVRARGATPVLLTPVARRQFTADGCVRDSHGEYDDAVREVALQVRVPLVDLEQRSRALFEAAGEEGSTQWFLWLSPGEDPRYPAGVRDNTHFSPLGAERIAAAVVAGLRTVDTPLRALLIDDVPATPPSAPAR